MENPLEKLSVGLMLDESQQKVWRKDKSLIGINISNLYQRVSNSQEASKYVAKEIENISKDDALLEKIVKINHAPTLLNLLNHFSDERKNKALPVAGVYQSVYQCLYIWRRLCGGTYDTEIFCTEKKAL